MKRRDYLIVATGISVSLTGCTGGDMERDAIVRAAEASPSANTEAEAVSYDELPQAEQEIARTAISEDIYHACPDIPDAVHSFSERFSTDEAYLAYEGMNYAVWIRIEDTVPVSTASPPETQPSC